MIFQANQNQPTCAVLLAVYNGMQYIEEQVQSILNQANVSVTIFASVDQSTDGSEVWVNHLTQIEEKVVMLPYGEKFGGAAKNFFRLLRDVDFSQFDYIAFADQDDFWFPDKLNKAISILQDTGYAAYSSNVTAFWPNGKQMLVKKSQPQKKWDFIFEAAGPGCTYVMSNRLASTIKQHTLDIWDKLQQVSLHDWYCYAFARANGYQWYIDATPSMLYRQHGKNEVGVNTGIKAYINRLKKIINGWWLTQACLVAELVGMENNRFVKSWSKLGRLELLRLSIHAFQCRRSFQEQAFFFLVCVLLAIIGNQQKDGMRFNFLKNNIQ